MKYDLICIGMALVDSIIKGFDPKPISASGYRAVSCTLNAGGEAVNEAIAASRLGLRSFRDEFFTDPSLHDENGKQVIILGLDVLPEYRHQGVASALMKAFLQKAKDEKRNFVLLTCHESKIDMYEHMGFTDLGLSRSVWGGVPWREMICDVRNK